MIFVTVKVIAKRGIINRGSTINMIKKLPNLVIILVILVAISWFVYLLHHVNLQVLNPQGLLAIQERNLIVTAAVIMLSIAIPVVLITFFIAWKYRAGNKKSAYKPEWTGNLFLKSLWWGILGVLVIVFWVIVWDSAHRLDPYKTINSNAKPITIQVVALQWKWLFIYPEQHIATVNFIEFPVNTPVTFKLTADAPMNSFWIPQLSGQIYAMSIMETQLHILANKRGDYEGGAAEINGKGFAGMIFVARASSDADFAAWVKKVKTTAKPLDSTTYEALDKPSENTPVTYYSSVSDTLYDTIIMKYMMPSPTGEMNMNGMHMKGMGM